MQRLFIHLGLLLGFILLPSIVSAQGSKVKLGDLAGEFQAPPLAELEKTVKWVNRPVLDGIELLRQKQAQEKPTMTASEALKLKNTTRAINASILSALGRLPVVGDRVTAGGAVFTVREMEGRRIETLAVDLHSAGDRRDKQREKA